MLRTLRSSLPRLVLAGLLLVATGCADEGADADAELDADTTAMDDMTTEMATGQTVGTHTQAPYGTYLVDQSDRSLYLFVADEGQQGSTCYDACAEAWPPLLTDAPPTAADSAQAALLGTIERRDGAMQVTYGGWPLYYYAEDTQSGDVQGQDVMGFGAEWYLVSPEGEEVHAEGGEAGS